MGSYKRTLIIIILLSMIFLSVSPFISVLLQTPAPFSAIRSFSMEPVLTRGDMVFVRPTNDDYDYKQDQVVVFRSEENGIHEWTMHRIVGGCEETGFITKGDANAQIDQDGRYPPIQQEWIAGVAPAAGDDVLKVPFIGYLFLFFSEQLKNTFLLSTMLALLALLIILRPRAT